MSKAQKIELLVSEIAILLIQQQSILLTAESCSGGWLSKYCTDIPGSSTWFEGGVVSYSNRLKQSLLHVPEPTLQQHGAVSEATAKAMAAGACQLVKADKTRIGLSITGVAGPTGGSTEKPVGTVCFAWARQTQNKAPETLGVITRYFDGDRQQIREQSVHFALKHLLELLLPS